MFRTSPGVSPVVNTPREFYFISNRSLPLFIDEINLATKTLENERACRRITNGMVNGHLIRLKIPNETIIIGDVHGDIKSLFSILQAVSFRRFLSNPNNKMIFLGDYVDRGSDSVGVLYTICYLKRKYPDSVVLLCGNHEASERFNFSAHDLPEEIHERYGLKSRFVYEKLLFLFKLLPKVVIIEDQLLIMHGGLPTRIEQNDFLEYITKDDNDIVEELLWNDPRSDIPNNQDWCVSRRGFGRHFGKNISKKYLALTHTKALVRGHEPCHGFKIDHGNLVLTLFSSKEAYQKFNAAFLFITRDELIKARNAVDLSRHVKNI